MENKKSWKREFLAGFARIWQVREEQRRETVGRGDFKGETQGMHTERVCVWSKNTSGIQLALVSGLEVVLDKKKDTSGSKKKRCTGHLQS